MQSSLIPYLIAEDNYRRDRARRQVAAAKLGRRVRRARRAR